jgi:hypothetical protein
MKYRAAAALPHNDRERVTAALCEQLRIMAVARRVNPDWETLSVDGPVEWPDRRGQLWFEWTATVESRSGVR